MIARGDLAVELGFARLTEMLQRITENIRHIRASGVSIVMNQYEAELGGLLIDSGDPAEAVRRLSDAITDSERRVECNYLPELYRVRALAHRALGERERGERDAGTALAIAVAQSATPLVRSAEATLRALLATRVDDDNDRIRKAIRAGRAKHE